MDDGSAQSTILLTVVNSGAGWYGGVAYNEYIYGTPYNADYVLKLNTNNKTLSEVGKNDLAIMSGKLGKFVNGTLASNGEIYFAPNNVGHVLILNPSTDTLSTISSSAWNTKENAHNCCNIIENPVDGMLYVMPNNCDDIVQIDPVHKTTKIVATIADNEIDKFATALLAPNGKIYCIPSYGYNQIVIFDPNTYDIEYLTIVGFKTSNFDVYNDAIVAPNNKIYFIPSGANSDTIWEFDIATNSLISLATIDNINDRWCGGKLNRDGKIMCLPYKAVTLLALDTKISSQIPSLELFKYFNK